MHEEETDLVRRAAQRDVNAWSLLYETHYEDLYAYSYSRLGAREDAEDVASQVFVEALKGIDRLARQRHRPVLGWLLGIARVLITARQRQRQRSLAVSRLAFLGSSAGDTDVVVENVDLHRALACLTQEQQDVLILRYFLGKTTHEIALLTGKQENAIFALQFRAVRSLRKHLSYGEAARILRTDGGSS